MIINNDMKKRKTLTTTILSVYGFKVLQLLKATPYNKKDNTNKNKQNYKNNKNQKKQE